MGKLPESPAEDKEIATEPSANRQPATDDFDVVARIIRDKGLAGNPTIREAMKILFPERAYRNWLLKFGLAPIGATEYSPQ